MNGGPGNGPANHIATCEKCGGHGWVYDHSDECYEAGDCVGCGGVQVECKACEGTGRVA